ncbi:MAG: hypothetical protein AVW06_00270 [Hadesarchaea archaeon DG-33-1]|nr:MAG: hypothetical protein AVW06_00270 [Hadesarchaea archaeon DG-33-1]
MRILFVHADYLNYKVRGKTRFAEEVEEASKVSNMADPLIALYQISQDRSNDLQHLSKMFHTSKKPLDLCRRCLDDL